MGGDGGLFDDYSDDDSIMYDNYTLYYNYVWVEIGDYGNDTFSMYDFYTVRALSLSLSKFVLRNFLLLPGSYFVSGSIQSFRTIYSDARINSFRNTESIYHCHPVLDRQRIQ